MRFLVYFLMLASLSCTKQHIDTSEVVYDLKLSPSSVDADGSSTITVSVYINKDAEATKRKVVFETSKGTFESSTAKTITVDAVYEAGLLVAKTTIKAPMSAGYVVVSAKPENRNPYNDFIVKDSVQALVSEPFSIKVDASAFSVSTDFLGEVQIFGTLKNSKNKNVSSGYKVLFEEYQNPATGRFRAIQNISDDNSKVSAYYSPGHAAPGTNLYVRCTVLDAAGNKTAIKDSVLLTVIP